MEIGKKQNDKWENIVRIIFRNKEDVRVLLTDESIRVRMQFFCIFVIFALVSGAMTVVNIYTSWPLLMRSTLIFAIANVVNILLVLINEKTEFFARLLFAVEILALFAFFLIVGEPEGFSAIWIALLPACGLLLYKLRYGIVLSLIQLVLVVFLFWTNFGNSLLVFRYTDSFLLRFPLLYIAFFCVGVFFEFIRYTTQKELAEMRKKYERLSKYDPLTELLNRSGYDDSIKEILSAGTENGCAVAIIDFDNFKSINDRFGHKSGDDVLKTSSEKIVSIVGEQGSVCRWGGDELSVFFDRADVAEKLCEKILTEIRELKFSFLKGGHITVSIGLSSCMVPSTTSRLFVASARSWKAMSLAASAGSGRIRWIIFTPFTSVALP